MKLVSMRYSKDRVAGALFVIAVTQFILGLTVAEALYPTYSLSVNYISDLGVGPSALVFNSTVFLLGLSILLGVFCLRGFSAFKTVNTLLLVMGLGALGVGVFTKDVSLVHGAVSLTAFFFAGLSAFASCQVLQRPFSWMSMILGGITLGALVLFACGMVFSGSLTSNESYDSPFYLGLGPGGMERIIVYPALIWLAGFGGHLASQQDTSVVPRIPPRASPPLTGLLADPIRINF